LQVSAGAAPARRPRPDAAARLAVPRPERVADPLAPSGATKLPPSAAVAQSADAVPSKGTVLRDVWVRVPPAALHRWAARAVAGWAVQAVAGWAVQAVAGWAVQAVAGWAVQAVAGWGGGDESGGL
jgi:hypothetical protein